MLWFPIMVNQREVGHVELVRISPRGHRPEDSEECTYSLKYFGDRQLRFKGTIAHPYIPDNPLPLIQAALEQVNGQQA